MKNFGNVIWGIFLIIFGLILGGNALGITNINIFFDGWWTLFIILPCFRGLFTEEEKTGSVIGLFVGIILLLCCQNVLNFDIVWKLVFPVSLIIIGISFIFKDTFSPKIKDEIKKLNENRLNDNKYRAIFSGQEIKFDGEKFNEADLTTIFGGIECDLRNAVIERDVLINTFSLFGGIDIFVPQNVKVKIKSSSIFGGVDKKRVVNLEQSDSHTIYINATCIFGGVDIK